MVQIYYAFFKKNKKKNKLLTGIKQFKYGVKFVIFLPL